MNDVYEIAAPLVVAFATTLLGALLAANLKYAKNKEEAISGIRTITLKVFSWCWAGWLLYSLGSEVISDDPLTRASVFAMIVYAISLSFMITMNLLLELISIMKSMMRVHDRHLNLTERLSLRGDEYIPNKSMQPSNEGSAD